MTATHDWQSILFWFACINSYGLQARTKLSQRPWRVDDFDDFAEVCFVVCVCLPPVEVQSLTWDAVVCSFAISFVAGLVHQEQVE